MGALKKVSTKILTQTFDSLFEIDYEYRNSIEQLLDGKIANFKWWQKKVALYPDYESKLVLFFSSESNRPIGIAQFSLIDTRPVAVPVWNFWKKFTSPPRTLLVQLVGLDLPFYFDPNHFKAIQSSFKNQLKKYKRLWKCQKIQMSQSHHALELSSNS